MREASDKRATRVLFVDDEPLARLVGRKCLEGAGCEVIEAESLRQAEEAWRTNEPDVVVLDHRLEDGCGIDLLTRMRAEGRAEAVVYLSAETEEVSDAQRAALGLSATLSKPVDLDALRAAVCGAQARAESSAGEGRARRLGRFLRVAASGALDAGGVAALRRACGGEAWVAIDAAAVSGMDEGGLAVLREWAQDARGSGGRLCVAGASGEVGAWLRERRVEQDVDVVEAIDGVEALGRRAASGCERLALIESVVRRDHE